MTNLDSILKSKDITFQTKGHLVKAMVFPVVMYRCESWTIKKTEHWRIDAFELWCWRRLLRVPWTARRSNQSILKEISPWWLSGKEFTCQCRRHEFNPWVGRISGRGNGNPLQCSCLRSPMDRGAWRAKVHGVTKVGHNWATKQQQGIWSYWGSKRRMPCPGWQG